MARAKKSKSQIYKDTYDKYKLALEYYNIQLKPLKQPTAKSVENAKSIWREHNKSLKGQGYIDLPTPQQLSKYLRENPLEENTVDVSNTLASFEIDAMIDSISKPNIGIEGIERASFREINKYRKAVERLRNKVTWARNKIGDEELSRALKRSDFMGRIEAYVYSSHYLYEETSAIDDEIIPLFDSLVDEALSEL